MLISVKLFLDARETEVSFPGCPQRVRSFGVIQIRINDPDHHNGMECYCPVKSYLFFSQKVFPGNSNAKDMIKQNLEEPVLALFVRVVPKEWENWPCMRVEVYGKPASKYREISSELIGLSLAF